MTMRRHGRAALVAAVLAATAVVAGGSWAATSASGVQLTESPLSNFPDMAFNVSLPTTRPLTAKQVTVTENGSKVPDVSVSRPGAEETGTVLLIDASKSMQGKPIVAAMAAARAFAERRSSGQRMAVITFNDEVTVVLPLTSDAGATARALERTPALATGTRINDAVKEGAAVLQQAGVTNGAIVLLSDGTDIGSTADRQEAIDAAGDAKARVFAVGLKSPQYNPDALKELVTATGGSYSEAASTDALGDIYAQLGYTLSNEYVLRYRSLAGPEQKTVVALRVKGIAGAARAAYTSPALPSVAETSGPSIWDRIVQSDITLILVILLVVSMVGYAVFRIVYRPHEELTRRIGEFVTLPEAERTKQREEDALNAVAVESDAPTEGWVERFESDLEIGRVETPMRTLILLTALGGIALGIVVAVLIGHPVGLLAALIAPFVTRAYVSGRVRRTRSTFADQLPENLDVVSSGLRSGHSFVGALAVCVDDAAEPSKSEFQRVIADEQLGVPLDEALREAGRRMENRDILQVALVAKLQRDAGTNAAEVLDQVSDNMRARLELRRLITALTAQGRMARWIVSLLPVVLFFAIYVLNTDYLKPLWTDPVGITGLVVGAIMVVTGSLVIKRILQIEV